MPQTSQKVRAARTLPATPRIAPWVIPLTDSIGYGVGSTTAGWRYYIYQLIAAKLQKLHFVGSVTWAGGDNGLAVNPQCECHPAYVVKAGPSQSPPDSYGSLTDASSSANVRSKQAMVAILAGGTNDLASNLMNDTPAGTAASISNWLDVVWGYRSSPKFQIVLCAVLRRLDADDSKVQALNALLPGVIAGKSYAANIIYADAIYGCTDADGMNDAVHPNDLGHQRYAAALLPYLEVAIARTA